MKWKSWTVEPFWNFYLCAHSDIPSFFKIDYKSCCVLLDALLRIYGAWKIIIINLNWFNDNWSFPLFVFGEFIFCCWKIYLYSRVVLWWVTPLSKGGKTKQSDLKKELTTRKRRRRKKNTTTTATTVTTATTPNNKQQQTTNKHQNMISLFLFSFFCLCFWGFKVEDLFCFSFCCMLMPFLISKVSIDRKKYTK